MAGQHLALLVGVDVSPLWARRVRTITAHRANVPSGRSDADWFGPHDPRFRHHPIRSSLDAERPLKLDRTVRLLPSCHGHGHGCGRGRGGKTAATASHHLKLLRDAGLVTGDKRGTWIFYRAVPERLTAIEGALSLTR